VRTSEGKGVVRQAQGHAWNPCLGQIMEAAWVPIDSCCAGAEKSAANGGALRVLWAIICLKLWRYGGAQSGGLNHLGMTLVACAHGSLQERHVAEKPPLGSRGDVSKTVGISTYSLQIMSSKSRWY